MINLFLVTPPGLEAIARSELLLKKTSFSLEEIEVHSGGVSVRLPERELTHLIRALKVPSKVLLRLKAQNVRDRFKLFKVLKSLPFRKFLTWEESFKIVINSSKSRMRGEEQIEKTAREAIAESLKAQAPKKRKLSPHQQVVQLRFDHDLLTVSLDCSGHPLYYRNDLPERSGHRASLRANVASALVAMAYETFPSQEYEFIDPMMGAGTLLREAHTFYQYSNRQFTCDYWDLETPAPRPVLHAPQVRLIGCDRTSYALSPELEKAPLLRLEGDSFKQSFPEAQLLRIVLSNPPYGERVKKEFTLDDLMKLYQHNCKAQAAVFIGPRQWDVGAQKRYFDHHSRVDCRISGLALSLNLVRFSN